jgi:hypothetical protein
VLLALKVRPEAFPNGSPMSVLKKLCNVKVYLKRREDSVQERGPPADLIWRGITVMLQV